MTARSELHDAWDAITVEDLVAQGSLKWTRFSGAIGMFIAEMDFGVCEPVREAIERAAATGALGYLPADERTAVRRSTAQVQQELFGWAVDPTNILVLPDVMSGLTTTSQLLTEPETPIIVFTPAYMPFLLWPATLGRELIQIECYPDDQGLYRLNLDRLDAVLGAQPPGTLVLLCNPWNPVGRVLTRAELEEFAAVIDKHGARVFSDEIHATLLIDPEAHHIPYASLGEHTAAHTTTGVSASKGWNIPGLKCGQLVLNQEDRRRISAAQLRLEDPVSILGGRATVAAYRHGQEWNAAVREYVRDNALRLQDAVEEGALPGVQVSPVQGTYIAWLDLSSTPFAGRIDPQSSPEAMATALREAAGVALTDGGLCGEAGRGFTRMVLGTPRPVLDRAIEQLSAALHA